MNNYSAWDVQILPCLPVDNRAALLHLVNWAVLAPSSHNTQPWRFELFPDDLTIEVSPLENEILPISDPSARQTYLSIGCAIRNMVIAARYYGYGITMGYGPRRGRYAARARLFENKDAASTGEPNENLMDAMIDRRMNRGKFISERAVPVSIVEIMRWPVDQDKQGMHTLDFISDALTKRAMAEIQYLADRYVVAKNDFRKELGRYMLPNDSKEYRGMPGSTFGLSDEASRRICAELQKDGPFDPNLAVGFAASSRDGLKDAPLIGVISCKEDNPLYWINAGGLLQWIALIAEQYGLGFSVHAAMVEVELFNKMLKTRLGRSERPTAIFRLGYPTEKRPHSPRIPAEFVVFDGNSFYH